MDANNSSSISQANSYEKLGEFWDSHDFTDYDTNLPDVEFELAHVISIESDLFDAIEKQAHERGVEVETLVNLWLQQKLSEQNQD
jgi:hypothetical protein